MVLYEAAPPIHHRGRGGRVVRRPGRAPAAMPVIGVLTSMALGERS